MKQVSVKVRRKNRALRIIAVIISVLLILAAVLEAGVFISHFEKVWKPDYAKEDISALLSKAALSEQDYELIYRQTGLTKIGVNAILSADRADTILDIQSDFFSDHQTIHDQFAPFTCCHEIDAEIAIAPLEEGDIIVSPTTHFSFFKLGHAAIVVDSQNGKILNATGYDSKSCVEAVSELTDRPAFMILRSKQSKEIRKQISQFALNNLFDLNYSISVGLIGNKFAKKADRTNCGHIVWYAFKQFGIDLDSNGGPFVFPSDIAASKELELVQVYGIDPKSI